MEFLQNTDHPRRATSSAFKCIAKFPSRARVIRRFAVVTLFAFDALPKLHRVAFIRKVRYRKCNTYYIAAPIRRATDIIISTFGIDEDLFVVCRVTFSVVKFPATVFRASTPYLYICFFINQNKWTFI